MHQAKVLRLLAIAILLAATNGAHAQAPDSQFCWIQGRYDLTIYYAEAEGREDRSESFAELLRISGIDFDDVSCKRGLTDDQRQQLFENWKRRELEVIDTTFMSDMDS